MNNSKHKVGWVRDAHGLKGELYIQLFAKQADWLDSFKQFWLEDKAGRQTEYEVERAKPHKDGLIVKSKVIVDRTQAEHLKGAQVFIPSDYLASKPGDSIFLKQIEGFRVLNGERDLGVIKSFSTNGAQDLLAVTSDGRDILIPFVEAFIQEIDFNAKIVRMVLPEGLVEVGEE